MILIFIRLHAIAIEMKKIAYVQNIAEVNIRESLYSNIMILILK